eukprot:TRINITY_DN19748_c0_g1_i1.p1 TRINITY_DN19748_c0_g1~~TRINITY_DN19748_c0_g1_i1.p1  ORF type:complete len:275 (+),score=50.61 TRINITY_DN19748_c0_g1_i1:80-904(+)
MIVAVREKLYLGDSDAASDEENLLKMGITDICTIAEMKPEFPDTFHYLVIPVLDVPEADLISYFDEALTFISNGLNSGAVLIHCVAGVSRSVAVLMAHLMKTETLTTYDCLDAVKAIHPAAGPNSGFMEQLELFEMMAFEIEYSHPLYLSYRVQAMANAFLSTGKVGHLRRGPKKGELEKAKAIATCYECRQPLFTDLNVLQHEVGKGQEAFRWKKRDCHGGGCNSYFIEPLRWMAGIQNKAKCCVLTAVVVLEHSLGLVLSVLVDSGLRLLFR